MADEEDLLKRFAAIPLIAGVAILAVLWFIGAIMNGFGVAFLQFQFTATAVNIVGIIVFAWLVGLVIPPLARAIGKAGAED